ncbi:hypothetical protein IVA94_14975 [Bradyrhizobium sp. 156]|uniref:hypothetical protein n=1 Tax=Bradyrhizobium sp. 156 TaxID=2782630 RepID=UPI001FFA887B|nr:hypothetical protein [Bradyrhizobium sp. 156]MCK1322172.1 hypothetical protein [Bradyrhizobium sp. 156]
MAVKVSVKLAEDRSHAELTFDLGSQVLKDQIDAHDLSGLIDHLMRIRAGLLDEVPKELDPHIRIQAVADPIWRAPNEPGPVGKRLGLRHPGLGWLWFEFPQAEADAIARHLTKK